MGETPITQKMVRGIVEDFLQHSDRIALRIRSDANSGVVTIPFTPSNRVRSRHRRAVIEALADKVGMELDYASTGNARATYWYQGALDKVALQGQLKQAAQEVLDMNSIEDFREEVKATYEENLLEEGRGVA